MYSDECSRHGVCSISPKTLSFTFVLGTILKASAYYTLKLQKLGYDCFDMQFSIISSISNLSLNLEYPDSVILDIITCHYNDYAHLKSEYTKICTKNGLKPKYFLFPLKLKPDMTLSELLLQGQKLINNKFSHLPNIERMFYDVQNILIKSASSVIVNLNDYDYSFEIELHKILRLFSSNPTNSNLMNLSNIVINLWKKLFKFQENNFGTFFKVSVNTSTQKGKSLLVSGSQISKLKFILQNLNDIDVYTNGDLLIAHGYPEICKFTNLKGHFSKGKGNMDFSVFPGPIYITDFSEQNMENLIRGNLLSTNTFVPKGVKKINKISDLREEVEKSKGFSKSNDKSEIYVGFNINDLNQVAKVAENYDNIIFASYYDEKYSDLVDDLSSKMHNSLIVRFTDKTNDDYSFNLNKNVSLESIFISKFIKRISPSKITLFFGACNYDTITNLIYLSKFNFQNIYLANCNPSVINPMSLKLFMEKFRIQEIKKEPS